ncbi:msx2-interacting protein isoform X2 [Anopheles stephensi]|uniref:msx2-interacting protein isoform X2 n=1 Tax=Anopheles stephensi TaxID=30069 RepID=UPI001658B01A|nr:msx2-interacting protein isoform X2 [Anopheles stephensi]
MPLYSELYHNFVGNTPIIPTPIVSVGSSTYSPPTYVGVSRAFPNPLSSASSRTAPSFTRGYVPKLTPITETPLTSTRIAALGRVSSPKFLGGHHHHHGHSSPTYQKPRRTINTADIDVSASKYAGGTRTPLSTHHRSLALLESSCSPTNYSGPSSPPDASSLSSIGTATINLSETERTVGGALSSVTPLSTRDQELNERSEQRRARSTINRNRTVVRLNTIRARSKSRGSRGSTEGRDRLTLPEVGSEPTFDEEMLLLEPSMVRPGGGSSWRDNFRDELSLRPRTRTEPSKSPGELLLEKHLIRDGESAAVSTTEPSYPPTRSPVPKRRGTIRRKSAVKIPSFHEICADISSDKLDDDLNAGELRRRASQLIEDELLQFQEELKKAATGANNLAPDILEERLKEALEQQIAQDSGVEVAEKRKQKKIKRTRTKVLPVPTPDEQEMEPKLASEPVVVVENAAPPRIVAELESIEECTVFKLPKKKKKQPEDTGVVKKSTTPGGLRKEMTEHGRTEPELQQVQVVIVDRPQSHSADLTNGMQDASKQASTDAEDKGVVEGAGPADTPPSPTILPKPNAEPRKLAKTGIKTYVRKKTVENLPEPSLSEALTSESENLSPKEKIFPPPKDAVLSLQPAVKKCEPEKKAASVAESTESVKPKEPLQLKSTAADTKQLCEVSDKVTSNKETAIKNSFDKPLKLVDPEQSSNVEMPASITATPNKNHPVERKIIQTAEQKINDPKQAKPNQTAQLTASKVAEEPIESLLPTDPPTAPSKLADTSVLSVTNKSQSISTVPSGESKPLAPPFNTEPTNKLQPAKSKLDEPGKLIPNKLALRKKPIDLKRSTDDVDFWSTIGTRETVSFARRKQQLVMLRSTEEEESPPASPSHPFQGLPTSPKQPQSAETNTEAKQWDTVKPAAISKAPTMPVSDVKQDAVAAVCDKTPVPAKSPADDKPHTDSTKHLKMSASMDAASQAKPTAVGEKVAKQSEPTETKKTKPIKPEPEAIKANQAAMPLAKGKETTPTDGAKIAQSTLASPAESKVSKTITTTPPESPTVKSKANSSLTSELLATQAKPNTSPDAIAPKAKPTSLPGVSASEVLVTQSKPNTASEPVPLKVKPSTTLDAIAPKSKPTSLPGTPVSELSTTKPNTPPEPLLSKAKLSTTLDATAPKAKPTSLSETPVADRSTAPTTKPNTPPEPLLSKAKLSTTLDATAPKAKPTSLSETPVADCSTAPTTKPNTPPETLPLKVKPSTTLDPTTPKTKPVSLPGVSASKQKPDTPPELPSPKAKQPPTLEPGTKPKQPPLPEKTPTKVTKALPAQEVLPIASLDTKKLSPKELIKAIAPNIAAAAEKKLAQEKTKPKPEQKQPQPPVPSTLTSSTAAVPASVTATTPPTDGTKPAEEPVKKVIVKKVIKVVKPKVPAGSKPKTEPEVDGQAEREQEQRRLAQQKQQNLERMQTKLNQITLNMGVKGTEVEVKECQKCQSAIVSEALPVPVAIVTATPTPKPAKQPIANGAKLTKNKFGTLDNLSDLSAVDVRDRNNNAGVVKPSVVKPKQTTVAVAAAAAAAAVATSADKQKVLFSSSEEDGTGVPASGVGSRIDNDSASETSFSGVEDDWSSEEEEDDDDDMANDKLEKKKPFDPTKRVKLNFDQMRKCYSKEEKSPIVLVARPRPLWKVKRHGHRHNRKADLTSSSSSGSGSSSDDESTSTSTTTSSGATSSSTNNTTDQTSSEAVSILDGATSDINTDSSVNSSTGGKQKGKGQQAKAKGQKGKPDPFSDIYDNPMVIPLHAEPRTSSRKSGGSFVPPPARDENNNTPADLDEDERARSIGGGHEVRSASTSSHDSGFYGGGTAPISPKKALETSYTYAQFQKTGKLTAPATVIPRFRKYNVDDFHFLTVLGKGSFGKVFLAELKNSDYYYAIKCLKKDVVLEDDDVDCTLIERKVLALGTKHPFLCHLFCTFQTDSHLFFVMEYLNGGDLMFHIQQSGRFPEARARFYAAEIVSGLKFLHRKGIVYRDLKLDNVLLDYDGHVRIADFGMCKLEIYLDKLADSFCGTPDYMAPEIIKGQKYNQAVDWWSFGVLVYEMLVGQSPFSGCDEDELFWSICNEIPWFPHYLSKEALRLLQSLLEKDASIRLGVLNTMDEESDIKYHPFFNSIIWDKLERRAVEPPFKPQVRHPLDTQYFDKQFTRERARLTPIDRNILASMDQAQFEGFTYTNPNNTLTQDNARLYMLLRSRFDN